MTPPATPSWKAPHLAAATTRRNTAVFGVLLAMVVLSTTYEGVLIKPAVSVALNERTEDWVAYTVAGLIALTAAFSMLESGYLHRKGQVEGRASALSASLIAGWALIGGALTLLRLIPEPSHAGSLYGGTIAQTAPPLLVAPVMLLVYVGAGLLSRATGTTLFNPTAQAHASARRSIRRIERALGRRRAVSALRWEQLEVARGGFDTVRVYRDGALGMIDAYFEQLRQRAHLRMLLPLGDPSITSAVGQSPFDDGSGFERGHHGPDVPPVRAAG